MWGGTQNETFQGDGGFNRDSSGGDGPGAAPRNLVHMMISDCSSQEDKVMVEGVPVDMVRKYFI
jgi:hypothetical protein